MSVRSTEPAAKVKGTTTAGNVAVFTTTPGELEDGGTPTGTGTVTNTGTLTDHEVIVGNGGVDVSSLGSLGSSGQVLTSGGAGVDPSWATSAATALTKIEEQTPTGTALTFSSLGSYTHLQIVFSARGDQSATSTNMNMTFNGDTGSNYDRETISAVATSPSSSETIAAAFMLCGQVAAATAPSGATGTGDIHIQDYRGTTFRKSFTALVKNKTADSSSGMLVRIISGEWRDTSAITSVTITLASGNFVTGSKFSLYGMS